MTRDEAAEVGRLVAALDNADELLEWANHSDRADEDEADMGVGLAHEYSDAGSSGPGSDAVIGQAMSIKVVEYMRGLIITRLAELGVEA